MKKQVLLTTGVMGIIGGAIVYLSLIHIYTLKENEKGEYQIYAVANAVTDGPSNTEPGNIVSDLEPGDDNAPDESAVSSDETQDSTESTPEQPQESGSESSEAA